MNIENSMIGICCRCKNNPVILEFLVDDNYCQKCIKHMAEKYLRREFKDEKIIIEAQRILMENDKNK